MVSEIELKEAPPSLPLVLSIRAGPWGWNFAQVKPWDLPTWCVSYVVLVGLAMGEQGWKANNLVWNPVSYLHSICILPGYPIRAASPRPASLICFLDEAIATEEIKLAENLDARLSPSGPP